MVGARGGGQRGHLSYVGEHLVPGFRPVQRTEGGAAGDLESTGVEFGLQPLRVGGEIAVRSELQPLVAGLGEFVEEAGVRDLLLVLGEPDAPGVGGGAQAEVARGGAERGWRRCHVLFLGGGGRGIFGGLPMGSLARSTSAL
jgi:hypothetical protein